jgi:hypothetical protein
VIYKVSLWLLFIRRTVPKTEVPAVRICLSCSVFLQIAALRLQTNTVIHSVQWNDASYLKTTIEHIGGTGLIVSVISSWKGVIKYQN